MKFTVLKVKNILFGESCSPATLLKIYFAVIFLRFCKKVFKVIFYDLPEIVRTLFNDAFNNSNKSNIQNIGETPIKCIKHMVFKSS